MTHPADAYELDPAPFDFAHEASDGALPGEDEFEAWYALYQQEGENARAFSYQGIFRDDIEFTQAVVSDLMDIPGYLVIDWPATSQLVTDYEVVDLPFGRKAYFR